MIPKLFDVLGPRYANRKHGCTRVLHCEPKKEDQARSAILELVDGPKDIRFALTAKTLAYRMRNNMPMNHVTQLNVRKVCQGRPNGEEELRELTAKWIRVGKEFDETVQLPEKVKVYPDPMHDGPKSPATRLKYIEQVKKEPWFGLS